MADLKVSKISKTRNKSRDYQEILRLMAKNMVRLKQPKHLLKIITRFIDREFGLTHTSLLVLEEERHRFIFVDSKGLRRFPVKLIKFDLDYPLIAWFQNARRRNGREGGEDFLTLPMVNKWCASAGVQLSAHAGKENGLLRVQKAMGDLKAELAIPAYYKKSLTGLLLLGQKKDQSGFSPLEISFLQILTQDCAMAVKMAQYHHHLVKKNQELAHRVEEIEKLRKKEHDTYYQIMRALAQEVNVKDSYTFGHVRQVERLGMMTAKEMGLDLSGRKKDILSASLILHDVGKIGIPDHILNKPSRLNPEEWEIMKTHVDKGAKILEPLTDFKEVAEIVRSHHENFDGSGYPRGLKGSEIPVEARIVSVVDAFHAIVSNRSYDAARPLEEAFRELEKGAQKQFDPEVVQAFIRAFKKNFPKRNLP
jgi:response regulator RpfG family c-di-GMP phosphodiesterase